MNDFRNYATKHLGMSGTALDSYMNITSSYISPTIIEERQLNVAQMDVFSRLMMDRIIFLGTQIDDYIFLSILIRRAVLSMPGMGFMIRCSSLVPMFRRFVQG